MTNISGAGWSAIAPGESEPEKIRIYLAAVRGVARWQINTTQLAESIPQTAVVFGSRKILQANGDRILTYFWIPDNALFVDFDLLD